MQRSRRVLVLRAAQQASALAEELRRRGMEPVVLPAIETVPPNSFAALDQTLATLSSFDWLVFTSANAVEAMAERLKLRELAVATKALRIAAIGPATAQAVRSLGWVVDLIPEQAVNESLAAALVPFAQREDGTPGRFLLPRAEEAREVLPDTLQSAGAEVTVATAYRTIVPTASIDRVRAMAADPAQAPGAIAFTSASTVRNLLTLYREAAVDVPAEALRVSIGPITSAALREAGLRVDAEAAEASVGALADAVFGALEKHTGS